MSMKMTMAEFVGLEPCPFCEGDLRRKVDELEAERDEIAELVGWHGEADGNSGRSLLVPMVAAMCEGSEVAEKLQAKVNELTADNDRLAKLLSKSLEEYSILETERDELQAQVDELEELARDLHADLMEYGCTPNAHRANYKPRFEALGIEVSE